MSWLADVHAAAGPAVDLVALAIPAFLLLIGVEVVLARRLGRRVIRFTDATADIACGIGNQIAELWWKGLFFVLYVWCFEHRLIDWGDGRVVPVVLGLVGVDLCYYWWHRASHGTNLLWAAHVVHHQSEDYNLAVALRQAWFTGLTSMPFYLPLALLGLPPWAYALGMGVNLLYQFWIHTELIGRLGPFEWVFNTPSHHRVHHGVNPEYLDKNHGGILIVWDRLFGTFEPEVAPPVYGTTEPLESFDQVRANLDHLGFVANLAESAPTLRQKLWTFVAHPAWRPRGMAPARGADLARAKYDPPCAAAVRRFVLAQQALVFPAVFALLLFAHRVSPGERVAAAATVVAITSGWAALFEKKSWAAQLVRTACVPWSAMVGLGGAWLLRALLDVPTPVDRIVAWSVGVVTAVGYAAWAERISRA